MRSLSLLLLSASFLVAAPPNESMRNQAKLSCTSAAGPTNPGVWSVGSAGSEKAPITVIVFSDFQSIWCGLSVAVLSEVLGDGQNVRVLFKHAPSPNNSNSMLAHEAAIAAGTQGKFWEMYSLLFAHQGKMERADLHGYASQLGLNLDAFEHALNTHSYRPLIDRDLAEARGLGVTITPTFFINGRRLTGPQQASALRAVMDSVSAGLPSAPGQDQVTVSGPAKKIDLRHAPTQGPASAPVSIVAFSDFECPYCAESVATIREVVKAYPTQVRFSFKHYPLPSHPESPLAHEAALAAGEQGKFWEMHDLLFATQDKLKREDLIRKAEQLKLDVPRFTTALDDHRFKEIVEADRKEGARLGVEGTPYFFLNGHALSDNPTLSDFKRLIDSELKHPGISQQRISLKRGNLKFGGAVVP